MCFFSLTLSLPPSLALSLSLSLSSSLSSSAAQGLGRPAVEPEAREYLRSLCGRFAAYAATFSSLRMQDLEWRTAQEGDPTLQSCFARKVLQQERGRR